MTYMDNINEILARNGLDEDTMTTMWVSRVRPEGRCTRRVLETVARLRDEVAALLDEVAPSRELLDASAKLADISVILAEVLR